MRNPVIAALSLVVFLALDLADFLLCVFYRILDGLFEGKPSPCYCQNPGRQELDDGLSDTLYRRKNMLRQITCRLGFPRKFQNFSRETKGGAGKGGRWSDCGCDSCVSWNGELKLHVSIFDHSTPPGQGHGHENVLLIHGFLSSSSFWSETVFPNLSEPIKRSYKLLAVDLLGFGKSPKPRECLYTLSDHLEMVENSVVGPFRLDSFHLVAHSMGCVVAIALAANHPDSVKSITLVAPPFFPAKEAVGSLGVLNKLAGKRLWPPLLFGSAVMCWYEHVGRSVCFLVCRNHTALEKILKLITRRRDLHFMIMDLTRHTHQSAWLTMHNVICGGSELMEGYLKVLAESGVKMCVVQGDRDEVVPIECSKNLKTAVPNARVDFVSDANHISVVVGRETEFTRYLEHIWTSCY